ncbi:unnamed protein product [Ilex paraguariensis]|uniref:Transducin/WD40 repeat-like superfamily protein n=1 Tax=Ilex paraguariensis TaxID=185542 RepID=A0ABC8RAE0_9AQUA
MKCQSVACIWSGSPPVHVVTATAVINRPPTLYTGGSDGSIIWWNLSLTDSNQEIKAVAMLCGHAAPIADLGICVPDATLGDQNLDDPTNEALHSNSAKYGALISACNDGVLCVWSRGSGHCRRRRKMPPWVGSPSMVRTLPENRRYVCIACCFVDAVHLFNYKSLDSTERDEALGDRESHHTKASQCTVVIVDSYTLTIVQTIFHGNLSIGPLKFMAVIFSGGDMEKQSVMMVDSFSKIQCVAILKENETNGENVTGLRKISSHLELTGCVDGSSEGGLIVAFATCGQVLAFVYRTYCIFRLVDGGTTLGKISFIDNQLCVDGSATQLYIIGGMFLEGRDARMTLNTGESQSIFVENFAVWNNRGSAVVYKLSYSSNMFRFEPVYAIPAVSHPSHVRVSISFIQLDHYLLRAESIFFHTEEPLLGKAHVTIWSLRHQLHNNSKFCQECEMLGEGSFFDDWIMNATTPYKIEGLKHDIGIKQRDKLNELASLRNCAPCPKNSDGIISGDEQYDCYREGQLISSSMVISENYKSPYAIVYGFYSGEIEVVHFDLFYEGRDFRDGSPHHEAGSHASRQCLLGHTGAVLCLAAHRMVGNCKGWSFNHVLVSGSMDCTIHIWDLESLSLITVLHHHVAPVRQIIFPPCQTDRPWSDCFLSVGDDSCVALASLETLRVERMFPGHPYYPAKVVWDSVKGYVACLCLNYSGTSDASDVLYIWDTKTGARERVLRGNASHSMFDHFCSGSNRDPLSASVTNVNTSVSSLLLPVNEEVKFSQSHSQNLGKGTTSANIPAVTTNMTECNSSQTRASKGSVSETLPITQPVFQSSNHPIKSSCPFPGIATLNFDLASLMSLCQKHEILKDGGNNPVKSHVNEVRAEILKNAAHRREKTHLNEQRVEMPSPHHITMDDEFDLHNTSADTIHDYDWVQSLEGRLLRFSLSFLHFWNVDLELDKLLITGMKLKRPEDFIVASGLLGDRGSLTLALPGSSATLELWKLSSEYCAMRSLAMVSLAQHMISLSHSCSEASRVAMWVVTFDLQEGGDYVLLVVTVAGGLSKWWLSLVVVVVVVVVACSVTALCFRGLAAFYTRNFAEKVPDIKPPLLQLLVSFWQDECEHVRMAARSLFHCAASRDVPLPLCSQKASDHAKFLGSLNEVAESEPEIPSLEELSSNSLKSDKQPERQGCCQAEESEISAWLESFEVQDWISCVGGTNQDAMTSHIIVAAALAVWYPSLVKPIVSRLVVHPLMKLAMAMNEKYSSTAAELLAEGLESTWMACIGSEIPRLIGDIFFQIESFSGASANSLAQSPNMSISMRESLVEILLPSLSMADIQAFLHVIERQIWSTASDSPVHVVSLMTLIRVARGSPRNLAQYLDKVVSFILQTMDPGNSVMRKTCFQSSTAALKEVVRVFPMVALNDTSTRLAVGDAIGEIDNASILVYDMHSMSKIKVLDASGPPGLPTLLGGNSETMLSTAISALCFSPDGEGLVAFSEHGLMIRWWSLGSVWWEKLSRNLVPVQCTKLIFVPPWEGFSPNSTRSSIMASVMGDDKQSSSQENTGGLSDTDRLKLLIHNLDLSYRLEWVGERKVQLTRHGHELGTFLL